MTLEWKRQEDADVWTAVAASVHVSIYRADNGHWFSIGVGMPPQFLGGDGQPLTLFQDLAEHRLRGHLLASLSAMGLETMCWTRGDAAEAAKVLGGRELRELAQLAGIVEEVVAQSSPTAAAAAFAELTPREVMHNRLLNGPPATWHDLKQYGDGLLADEVIHELRQARKIEMDGMCAKTGVAIWRASKR